MIYVVKTA